MRQINNHMKDVVGIEPIKSQQPKPSFNPKNWNWTAIIVWAILFYIGFNIIKFLINLIQ